MIAGRMSITTSDGQVVSVRRWDPESRPHRAIIGIHGIMTHAGAFEPLAEAFVMRGFSVIAADRRGSGEHSRLPGRENMSLWIDDTLRLMAQVRSEFSDITLL